MNFSDILDILIIAILVYIMLLLLKQTRSRSIMIGIGIAGVVYIVAAALHLGATLFIFHALLPAFLLALVVIFQADLRRFFEMIGAWSTHYPYRFQTSSVSHIVVVETILEAVEHLSAKKMGALMVIKGNEPIDRHAVGGIILGGHVSSELLESLFDNHSPGHDGAAIIENEIVTLFGVRLPLSRDSVQIAHQGTRHAAALGLAERSDCFVVVVSEETGALSSAFNGKIEHADNVEKLRRALEYFYQEKYPLAHGRILKNVFKRNYLEKLAAFVGALLLWYLFRNR